MTKGRSEKRQVMLSSPPRWTGQLQPAHKCRGLAVPSGIRGKGRSVHWPVPRRNPPIGRKVQNNNRKEVRERRVEVVEKGNAQNAEAFEALVDASPHPAAYPRQDEEGFSLGRGFDPRVRDGPDNLTGTAGRRRPGSRCPDPGGRVETGERIEENRGRLDTNAPFTMSQDVVPKARGHSDRLKDIVH